MTYLSDTLQLKKDISSIYYVDTNQADDTGDGLLPSTAKKTIGAAISLLSAGDVIRIGAGTYTETGLDLDTNYCEMWFDLGAILDPATGTALTISGNYCRAICEHGALKITPAVNETGVLLSGNFGYLSEIRVACFNVDEAHSADLGFDLTGDGGDLRDCRSSSPDVAAFKIQGDSVKLEDCLTGGGIATGSYSSVGFWVTNNCDKTRIRNCGSQGHGTAGFQVDAGCTNGVMKDCSSGGGDGKKTDSGTDFVWSDYTFDDEVYHDTDWSSVGGGAGSDNLFKVSGNVFIEFLLGDVETQMHADVDNLKLDLYDGTNTVSITGNVDTASADVGSVFMRTKVAASALTLMNSDQCRINEDENAQRGLFGFIINQKKDTNTYIRATWSGNGGSGKIHWHCHWLPLIEDGFVEAV